MRITMKTNNKVLKCLICGSDLFHGNYKSKDEEFISQFICEYCGWVVHLAYGDQNYKVEPWCQ